MPLDKEKFKSLIHYICWRSADDPSKLGAIKLNKILWLADFRAYYQHERPITGARYVKRQFGPVPTAILPAIEDLCREQALEVRDVLFHGYTKKQYIAKRPASTDAFSPKEMDIIEAAIAYVADAHTATSISNLSHDHIWKAAEDGEEIPYSTIFSIPGKIQEDERQWARQELEVL